VALAVFFLLGGMLFTEVALLGIDAAGLTGALLLAVAAVLLARQRQMV
jgi:hypothetical protein